MVPVHRERAAGGAGPAMDGPVLLVVGSGVAGAVRTAAADIGLRVGRVARPEEPDGAGERPVRVRADEVGGVVGRVAVRRLVIITVRPAIVPLRAGAIAGDAVRDDTGSCGGRTDDCGENGVGVARLGGAGINGEIKQRAVGYVSDHRVALARIIDRPAEKLHAIEPDAPGDATAAAIHMGDGAGDADSSGVIARPAAYRPVLIGGHTGGAAVLGQRGDRSGGGELPGGAVPGIGGADHTAGRARELYEVGGLIGGIRVSAAPVIAVSPAP